MRFTIGRKLAVGFGAMMLLVAISAGISYQKISNMRAMEQRLIEVAQVKKSRR